VPRWREAMTRGPHPGRRDRAEPLARPTRRGVPGGQDRVGRSMLRNGLIVRAASVLVGAVLVCSCGVAATPKTTPVPRALQLCDYICLAIIDTPSGTIAMGTGWDKDARLDEGYAAAWVVRDGSSTKAVLTREEGVVLSFLVPWGDGAVIIAGGLGAGSGYLSWITRDGISWEGPTPFRLPGEGASIARLAIVWGARIVITGERLIDDRYFASVWTSTDAVTWQLSASPPEFDDVGFTRVWQGGDGLVVGVALGAPGEPTQEWPWTTADLVRWRPLGSPYPCSWDTGGLHHPECRPSVAP